jgi:hypothetical protein
MMLSDQLSLLAQIYTEKTGDSLYALGMKVGRQKLFTRLKAGKSFYARTGEDALHWFAANWPDGVPWPRSIARPAVLDDPSVAKSPKKRPLAHSGGARLPQSRIGG